MGGVIAKIFPLKQIIYDVRDFAKHLAKGILQNEGIHVIIVSPTVLIAD